MRNKHKINYLLLPQTINRVGSEALFIFYGLLASFLFLNLQQNPEPCVHHWSLNLDLPFYS